MLMEQNVTTDRLTATIPFPPPTSWLGVIILSPSKIHLFFVMMYIKVQNTEH